MSRVHVVLVLALAGLVAVGASAARASISGVVLSGPSFPGTITEGQAYTSFSDTFTDSNGSDSVSGFTATIDWGDGTTDTAIIAGSSGSFMILSLAGHTYADEGPFTVTVTLTKTGFGSTTSSGTASVHEGDVLAAAPGTISTVDNTNFSGTVATFTDTLPSTAASDFTVTTSGATGPARRATSRGPARDSSPCRGSHAYAQDGSYSVNVTVADDSPGTAHAAASLTAQVTEGDVLVGLVDPVAATEGATFSGQLAEFSDALTGAQPSGFLATISWGDGTTGAGSVGGANGSFSVSGAHKYAEEGSFIVTVTFAENDANPVTVSPTRTVTVQDARLAGASISLAASGRKRFSVPVASFADSDPAAAASDFSATINWGDGHTSAGAIARSGNGTRVTVIGTHAYARTGSYRVTTVVHDKGGSSTTIVGRAVDTSADLALSLGSAKTAASGSQLTYMLKLTNRGPSTATRLTLTDALPARARFERLSAHGLHCRAPRAGKTGKVTCNLASLAAHASVSVRIVVKISRGTSKQMTDTATVASHVFDPTRTNDTAKLTTRIG